jgi:hypothetical protein
MVKSSMTTRSGVQLTLTKLAVTDTGVKLVSSTAFTWTPATADYVIESVPVTDLTAVTALRPPTAPVRLHNHSMRPCLCTCVPVRDDVYRTTWPLDLLGNPIYALLCGWECWQLLHCLCVDRCNV